MSPEQRLWLAVLLQGIVDTDTVTGRKGNYGMKYSMGEYDRAVAWYNSEEFDNVCGLAGITVKLARQLTPEKAREALSKVLYVGPTHNEDINE